MVNKPKLPNKKDKPSKYWDEQKLKRDARKKNVLELRDSELLKQE